MIISLQLKEPAAKKALSYSPAPVGTKAQTADIVEVSLTQPSQSRVFVTVIFKRPTALEAAPCHVIIGPF